MTTTETSMQAGREMDMHQAWCTAIYKIYSLTIVPHSGVIRSMQDWMTHPRVGDLVMEISSIRHLDRNADRMGYLERIVREPVIEDCDSEDDEFIPDNVAYENYWYLRTLDGREVKWFNAEFIRVPTALLDGYAWEDR